jgi:hypothetical protein
LDAFDIVCGFFKVFPVNGWDFVFKFVVLFFSTLGIRCLPVTPTVVREIADAADFFKVVPSPSSDAWPVFFFD